MVDPALIYVLECIREHFDKPVTVNCACRCESHNKAVGGAVSSQHLPDNIGESRAADIKVKGVSPKDVADYAEELLRESGGVGRYGTFTHVDVRGYKARWGEN